VSYLVPRVWGYESEHAPIPAAMPCGSAASHHIPSRPIYVDYVQDQKTDVPPISLASSFTSMSVLWLVVLFARILFAALTAADIVAKAKSNLVLKLAQAATISFQDPLRWSEYHAPDPAVVVNVKSEADV
jgi:hypothetical protein